MHVSATGSYTSTPPQVSTTTSGRAIVVTASCSGDCDLQLRITVPAELATQVNSASAEIVGIGLSNSLDLHTSDGAITLTDPTGPLALHSGSGAVTITGGRSTQADINTGDGAVDAKFMVAPTALNVTTKGGGVDLSVPRGSGYYVNAHSPNATPEIDLPIDRNATHALTITTNSGGIHVH